jgi:sulfite reductase (NADPH) flavoprotein alpha-component
MTIDRKNPVPLRIKERYRLTGQGSTKVTYHVVLDLCEAPLSFKVGDSIGVYAENDPDLVAQLLAAAKFTGHEEIIDPRSKTPMTLKQFLLKKANLSRLTPALHRNLITDADSYDPIDFFKLHPAPSAQEFTAGFAPLLPRFYSVASSQKVIPNEVHLTVALSSYEKMGEVRFGVASHFLCNLARVQETPILGFVQPSLHFTLPPSDDHPIIMIGPGTGIAPFRAFIQERHSRKAAGKNWLFFGERHRTHDFLYEEFLAPHVDTGFLKLDLAFSRDTSEKIYVQHRMLEQGRDLWTWINQGAFVYICGDADPMAKDVEASLLSIFQQHGKLSPEQSRQFLTQMRKSRQLLVDVY